MKLYRNCIIDATSNQFKVQAIFGFVYDIDFTVITY